MQHRNVVVPDASPRQVDLLINDETQDHIWVSIRIPKHLINQNLHFLAALSETSHQAVSATWQTLVSPPTKRMRLALHWYAAACGAAAILLVPMTADTKSEPPDRVYYMTLDEAVVTQDEPLQFTLYAHRKRFCDAYVHRFFLTASGKVIWSGRQQGLTRAVVAGPTHSKVTIPLPAGIEPGTYVYRAQIHHDCGQNDRHVIDMPDNKFHVKWGGG